MMKEVIHHSLSTHVMASQSEQLKVIFFQPASNGKSGQVVADGYFSFVPTFQAGDAINMTLARKDPSETTFHDPIGHKTHRIAQLDWVLTIDQKSKEALATLVVSVEKIETIVTPVEMPAAVPSPS